MEVIDDSPSFNVKSESVSGQGGTCASFWVAQGLKALIFSTSGKCQMLVF